MADKDISENLQQPKPSWRNAIRGNVLAMGLVSLLTDLSSEMMNPLLPIFIAGLVPVAAAPIYIGLMEGLAETTASLLKIFSGRISDKLGKRKGLVMLGYGLSAIARPAMALAMAGWHVIALKFLDRVGKGIRTSPRDALIGDSVPGQYRGLAFSFHRTMDHVGAVLGPIVAIVVLHYFLGNSLWSHEPVSSQAQAPPTPDRQMNSLRWLFALAIIPGVLAMLAIVVKVRETALKIVKNGDKKLSAWKQLPKRFYMFVGIVTIFALGNSSDLFIIYLGNKYFGMGLLQLMLLWIAMHISKIAFGIPGGILSDKFGRRPVIIAGWLVYALVYLGFAWASPDSPWQFWALVVAYGFYYGMTEGAEKALVADFAPSEHRGSAFGLYHGAVGLAALPASLMFGVFWAQIGPKVAFSIGAGLAALAAVLFAVFVTTLPHKDRAAA